MTDRSYDRYAAREEPSSFNRFGRWLSRRPTESWMFFIAGVVIAGIFF